MAKSDKFSSKVPALADYKPSFVNEDGEIEDVEAAIKVFHTLMVDKAKAQDAREDAQAETKQTAQERDALQKQLDDKADPDTKAELDKVKGQLTAAEANVAKERGRADRLEVAAEKGLTPAQAKRLVGDTKEELEADADEILEVFGAPKKSGDDEDDEEETGRSTPQTRLDLTNGGDPVQHADAEPDYEKIALEIGGSGPL